MYYRGCIYIYIYIYMPAGVVRVAIATERLHGATSESPTSVGQQWPSALRFAGHAVRDCKAFMLAAVAHQGSLLR